MSNWAIQFLGCVALAIAGMIGLHFGVDYSGFVLFIGLMGFMLS